MGIRLSFCFRIIMVHFWASPKPTQDSNSLAFQFKFSLENLLALFTKQSEFTTTNSTKSLSKTIIKVCSNLIKWSTKYNIIVEQY